MSEWRDITLGDFVALQRGHDLTEPQRRIGRVPVMGSAGQNGFHDTAIAEGAEDVLVNTDSCVPEAKSLDPIFKRRMFSEE